MKDLNVAFCFYGFARETSRSWGHPGVTLPESSDWNNLIKKYNSKVFFSTWDVIGNRDNMDSDRINVNTTAEIVNFESLKN